MVDSSSDKLAVIHQTSWSKTTQCLENKHG